MKGLKMLKSKNLFLIITIIFSFFILSCEKDPTSLKDKNTVTDIDGNVYKIVKIGDQWWMAENLRVTRYQNGDSIPDLTGNFEWGNQIHGAFHVYNNDYSNIGKYGLFFNWHAVNDSRKIAPEGWHVPTDEEWKNLEMALGMTQTEADSFYWRGDDEGGKLKETGTEHWWSPNTGATNSSGFCALAAGHISDENNYSAGMGINGYWWCNTESSDRVAWYRRIYYDYSSIYRSYNSKRGGLNVRCVKD